MVGKSKQNTHSSSPKHNSHKCHLRMKSGDSTLLATRPNQQRRRNHMSSLSSSHHHLLQIEKKASSSAFQQQCLQNSWYATVQHGFYPRGCGTLKMGIRGAPKPQTRHFYHVLLQELKSELHHFSIHHIQTLSSAGAALGPKCISWEGPRVMGLDFSSCE